jgi:hypothetical protein
MDKSSKREIRRNATCVGSRCTAGNKVCVPIALVFLLSMLAACAGTMSGTGDSGEILVFAVSEDTAFLIIRDSMLPVVREGTTVLADSPQKGYTGTIKLGLDKDRITAVMIPAKGRNAAGTVLDGYRFEVIHSGTAAAARIPASRDIMRNIVRNASMASEPLTLID